MNRPSVNRPAPTLRFALGSIPVEVQPLFPIVLAVMGLAHRDLAGAVAWTLVAGASVLWHELGHAIAMRWCGSAPRVELHAMGGLTHWAAGARPTSAQALAVSAAGPGAGLLLGAAFWLVAEHVAPATELAAAVVRDGLWVNVAWSIFNLLPILPLDGAHIVDHGTALVTCRLVELDRLEEAVTWAKRAARAAGPDARALLADPALEPLRDHPEFREIVAAAAPRAWRH